MAFARRTMRCSSSPSLTIFTRSARSTALRKLRFVFTRRVESIPLIRSNDFRKGEESRYTSVQRQAFICTTENHEVAIGVSSTMRLDDFAQVLKLQLHCVNALRLTGYS